MVSLTEILAHYVSDCSPQQASRTLVGTAEEKMLRLTVWQRGIWFQHPFAVCIIKPNFPDSV